MGVLESFHYSECLLPRELGLGSWAGSCSICPTKRLAAHSGRAGLYVTQSILNGILPIHGLLSKHNSASAGLALTPSQGDSQLWVSPGLLQLPRETSTPPTETGFPSC